MVLRGSYGVRKDYKDMNACISKVHSGSFYRIANILRESYWVRTKYKGMDAGISKVHTGSYGVGYPNH